MNEHKIHHSENSDIIFYSGHHVGETRKAYDIK